MRLIIFLLFFGFFAHSVFAVQNTSESKSTTTLPEITVKADKTKLSLTVPSIQAAKESINRTAGGVGIVDAADYRKGRASNLQDALGYSAGIYVQPRFGAEEARLSIRGSGIQRTFHLRGIKLLQDGIPINQADGGGDFQSIDPLSLQYIEVYRGANALRYGSTTLGGAVNFVTPTGYAASPLQARFEFGSFNYLREQVSSGAVIGPVDYYISLSESRLDGFRNHADQWNQRLFSNYGIRLQENIETRFYLSLIDSKSKLPGSLTKAQMRQNPKQNNAANVTGNQKRDYDQIQLANKTTLKWNEQRVEIGTYYVYKDLFHPIFQVLDIVTHDFGNMIRYVNEKPLFDRKNIFLIRFNPVLGLASDSRHGNAGGSRGARTAESRQQSYNLELFVEEQHYIFSQLALVAGMQWSFASRQVWDRFTSDGDNSAHPTYKEVTPKAGLRYEFNERSQAFANFSRSFEPPSFGELTNVTGGRVLDLNAQTASTVEVGTRGEQGRISWDFAYYYSWVENELLGLNDGNGNPLGTVNAYGTRHQGIELGAGIRLLEGILTGYNETNSTPTENPDMDFDFRRDILGIGTSGKTQDRLVLRGIYNWSRFRFSKDPAFSDNPLPGIPEHFMRAELVYEHPSGIYLGPNLEWAFKKYAVDMNNTLFTEPYVLLGLKGGYRTKKGISFFIEAKNLINEIYAATTGVIANANGADSAQFLPGDGRSVYSGVEFNW